MTCPKSNAANLSTVQCICSQTIVLFKMPQDAITLQKDLETLSASQVLEEVTAQMKFNPEKKFYFLWIPASRLPLIIKGALDKYTAIFLINGLCIVYCSLLQCLTLVYLGWGQKSEFFCLLVTTRRLQSGTVVGYRSTTTAYCRYMAAKGHWSTPG